MIDLLDVAIVLGVVIGAGVRTALLLRLARP